MYTFCPDCATIFSVSAEHVNAAGGQVRCGACANVFNATEHLRDDLASIRRALVDYSVQKAGLSIDEKPASPKSDITGEVPVEPAPVAQTPPVMQGPAVPDQPDDDAESPPLLSTTMSHPWARQSINAADVARGAVIVVMLILLMGQWLFFNRAGLAKDAGWRPVVERFCSVIHCELPLRTDLSRIELLNRDVRKHPLVEDALLVYATLNNSAEFPQPYPVFSISFSDVAGKPVAMRHFMPVEYLDPEVDLATGMVPAVPVYVVMAIQDPGEDAVSFQFEFL